MRMIFMRLLFLSMFAMTIGGCADIDPITPGPVNPGSADFTRYVAVGNSLTAGVQSGGLVDKFQNVSFPALIAESARLGAFEMPLVSEPGIPALLNLEQILPTPIINPLPGPDGSPTNLMFPGIYNNLGIPGALLHDLRVRRPNPVDAFGLVLRDTTLGPTAIAQALNAQPTFVTAWMGANDILGSASMGTDLGLTDVTFFENEYRAAINALNAGAGAMVTANLPDITAIPFFTTIPWFVVDPVTRQPVLDPQNNVIPLIGPGPANLVPGTLVTLRASASLAQGIGIPVALGGTGNPLPDTEVINPTELANIQTRLGEFNAIIDSICTNRGVPVVDMFAFFNGIKANGIMLHGNKFTADFISGGLFSLDGVHPSSLGYLIVAREFIRVINANFGASLPDPPLPLTSGMAAAMARSISPLEYVAAMPPGAFDGVVRMLSGSNYR
ncbi:MAG: SGNH/GDSL hydrolase family protein [Candidatus Krumholzibacteria bacterium]